MVTRSNKLSAMIVTVAIFFFAALSTAQAALDTSLDLWYDVVYAKYNPDGSEVVLDYLGFDGIPDPILANPWGYTVGDKIHAVLEWDSSKVMPTLEEQRLGASYWKFTTTLGGETISTYGTRTLLFNFGEFTDFLAIEDLVDYELTIFANSFSFSVDNGGFANDAFAISAFRGDAPGTAPVPLPSAVWLFGSGLLGMVGIRRKIRK